jgi:hypothetical protein
MVNDYRKIYKGARIVRANASTETDLHEHSYGSGYDEYPIDPAILQEAENYVSRTGEMIFSNMKAKINSKKSKGFARGFVHKTINRF